ncbi:hypothetical protein HAX54_032647, partial [Datura stramonium]|nr:hypothetical protein [Datura stramonium]
PFTIHSEQYGVDTYAGSAVPKEKGGGGNDRHSITRPRCKIQQSLEAGVTNIASLTYFCNPILTVIPV